MSQNTTAKIRELENEGIEVIVNSYLYDCENYLDKVLRYYKKLKTLGINLVFTVHIEDGKARLTISTFGCGEGHAEVPKSIDNLAFRGLNRGKIFTFKVNSCEQLSLKWNNPEVIRVAIKKGVLIVNDKKSIYKYFLNYHRTICDITNTLRKIAIRDFEHEFVSSKMDGEKLVEIIERGAH